MPGPDPLAAGIEKDHRSVTHADVRHTVTTHGDAAGAGGTPSPATATQKGFRSMSAPMTRVHGILFQTIKGTGPQLVTSTPAPDREGTQGDTEGSDTMTPTSTPKETHRDLKALGQMVRTARLDAGLTQRDVAQAIGVKVDQIGAWENGRMQPSRPNLDALATILTFDRDEVHVLLGLIPQDVIAAWLMSPTLRQTIRRCLSN